MKETENIWNQMNVSSLIEKTLKLENIIFKSQNHLKIG